MYKELTPSNMFILSEADLMGTNTNGTQQLLSCILKNGKFIPSEPVFKGEI